MPAPGFSFGRFSLDTDARRLLRDGVVVPLSDSQYHLLHTFIIHAGRSLTKDELIKAGWRGVIVDENALTKAVQRLRTVLNAGDAPCAIVTERGSGYRLTGTIVRTENAVSVPAPEIDFDSLLAPHRVFTEGIAALETLERDQIIAARHTFTALLTHERDNPKVHVGLATACALAFEATRADAAPDIAALELAAHHAREACRLNPDYAEAWATLGFVLERTGARADALAALRRSTALEPGNWRHHLRHAYGSWGEERLSAVRATLKLLPGLPMAHLLAVMVLVARDAVADAEHEIDAGLAAVAMRSPRTRRFSVVALHWVKGLLLLARGHTEAALEAFRQELALESYGHLYARECSANAWYAIGVCHLRQGDLVNAEGAFAETLARVPRHPMARAVAVDMSPSTTPVTEDERNVIDAAMRGAVRSVANGHIDQAVRAVEAALASGPPGHFGWLLPIEPMLHVGSNHEQWLPALSVLRHRAM